MKPLDFDYLRDFLKARSGLVLSSDKVYLVESRLMPVARRRGIASLDDLIRELKSGRDDKLFVEVTDAMTTNESFFFRDIAPFESFREAVLPRVLEARRKTGQSTIRIWSAACSSGQEAYSLAMILKENAARFAGFRYEIVGTDLSTHIVGRAREGTYSQFEVQRGLPVQLMVKYFTQKGDQWQIVPELRQMASFRTFNLLEDYRGLGRFDIVFCRNVLIYFDQPTKQDVLRRIAQTMPPDGVLYLGGAESVLGISRDFQPVPGLRGVYALGAGQILPDVAPPRQAAV